MIKVFKLRDLIGYLAKIIIVLLAVALVINVLKIGKKDSKNKTATDSSSALLFCIDDMLPQMGINKKIEENKETSGIKFAFLFIPTRPYGTVLTKSTSRANPCRKICLWIKIGTVFAARCTAGNMFIMI